MRTTRSDWASPALLEFDSVLRETLESILGTPLDDESWQQAQLSTTTGGMGLCSADAHAPAAFLASTTSSCELCKKIDSNFAWGSEDTGLDAAAGLYNA